MKINQITLHNFRQYYATNSIDLTTTPSQNIVIIGGKNGFGKTNLLLALVWCLYGAKMESVDDNFKREVKKERNFAQFMKRSLNWSAENDGENSFFVELFLEGVQFTQGEEEITTNCVVKREFNVEKMEDILTIYGDYIDKKTLNTEDDKARFINEYIVPVEIAKFVFFDAEKIASLAELKTKEEGTFMNEALGKLLGLDTHETLVKDLDTYIGNLKRDNADKNVKDEIISCEKEIIFSESAIEQENRKIQECKSKIQEKKVDISEINEYLSSNTTKATQNYDKGELLSKQEILEKKLLELEEELKGLTHAFPLYMLGGILESLVITLENQEKEMLVKDAEKELAGKFDDFLESLFNREPHDANMNMNTKFFYFNKAKKLYKEIFTPEEEVGKGEGKFQHDITKADKELIKDAYSFVLQQSKSEFHSLFNDYKATKNEIEELKRKVLVIESDLEDESISEYISKRDDIQKSIDTLQENIGKSKSKIEKEKKNILRNENKLRVLQGEISTRDEALKKQKVAEAYKDLLSNFIAKQKRSKEEKLEDDMYNELLLLMHKNRAEDALIKKVEVRTLPNNGGLKVILHGQNDVLHKETLSQGEKQLYISCLIKAILNQAIQEFPIFIDTPLGRLDKEHINKILEAYYPNLATQVVLLATDNEISTSRFKSVESKVAQSYTLVNKQNKTSFQKGYFQYHDEA